jgi:methyl-accepting chemotaxis protein
MAVLKNNINSCIDNIKAMVDDANMLTNSASKGDLSKRADLGRHQGEYRNIIAGVNRTLDTVTEKAFWYEQILDAVPFPLSVTDMDMNMTYLNRASLRILKRERQDLIGKPCHEWNGPICRTKNCGIVRFRQGEPSTTSDRDGKALQVDVSYIQNAKGENIGHVEVIQDVTAKVREAKFRKAEFIKVTDHMKKLAEGNLDFQTDVAEADEYTKDVHALYVDLNASVTQVRDSIKALVGDANALSGSALEGKLQVRADVNKHKGEYRNVIRGINDTLDAVVTPLRAAMDVAAKISEGDLTARVVMETKGDIARFCDSLNRIGESLTELVKEVDRSVDLVSSTSQELASSAEEMNASTEQVSAAIQQISKGAQSQATQVDETAKIMANMSTSVIQVVDKAQSATASAKRGEDSAIRGKGAVDATVKKMQEIARVVDESAKVIENLGKRSEEIGEIVGVITGISDQTNLLASTRPSRPRGLESRAAGSRWWLRRSRTWPRTPGRQPSASPR